MAIESAKPRAQMAREWTQPFDSYANPRHRRWELEHRVGHNWSIATLSLIRPASR